MNGQDRTGTDEGGLLRREERFNQLKLLFPQLSALSVSSVPIRFLSVRTGKPEVGARRILLYRLEPDMP